MPGMHSGLVPRKTPVGSICEIDLGCASSTYRFQGLEHSRRYTPISSVVCVCVCLPGIRFASCHVTYLFGHHLQEQHLICGYASGGPQKAARVFASYYHKQQQQQQQQQQENAHTATEC